MNKLSASCFAEYLKIRSSKVFWLTIAALCLGPLFGSIFVLVLNNPELLEGNEMLIAKAEMSGFTGDWNSFFKLISQVIGVGGVIVFGFIASWIFGREYSDHTVKDLFALPVSRTAIIISKLIACVIWCFTVVIAVLAVSLALGFLLNLPGWEWTLFISSLYRIFLTTVLTILLCPPVFLVASITRGYLGSLGFVILTVVLAQIIGALGLGAYVPWAVPALFTGMGSSAGGSLNVFSYIILVATSVAGLVGTIYWWKFADQAK